LIYCGDEFITEAQKKYRSICQCAELQRRVLMKQYLLCVLLMIPILSGISSICHADAIQRDLFILGVQLGGAQCVASLMESYPTESKPGAMSLIARNLGWSVDTTKRLGVGLPSLNQLQATMNGLSFTAIRQSLDAVMQEAQKTYGPYCPQAANEIVMGINLEGAECIASNEQAMPRAQRPGSGDLIVRNMTWLLQGIQIVNLGLSQAPVSKVIKETKAGATFASLLTSIGNIRLKLQAELEALPACAAPSAGNCTVYAYGKDETDGSDVGWNSLYPNPSFDDDPGRRGYPNAVWEGAHSCQGNQVCLSIKNLRSPYPPSHVLSVGYTVVLNGAMFDDGSNTRTFVLYRFSGEPQQRNFYQCYPIKGSTTQPPPQQPQQPQQQSCDACAQQKCPECKDTIVLLCIASGNDACQRCIDTKCPH
jgi:hypothetical protein